MAKKYDLTVIGSGPGGYEAALRASKLGMKTVVVEERELGGTCLNRGCIPTKTMLHSTELLRELNLGEEIGLSGAESVALDMGKLQDRKEDVLAQLRAGIALLLKKDKVEVCSGHARIVDSHTVCVEGDAKEPLLTDKILIATGSIPAMPRIPGIALPGVMTSDELLNSRDVCQHLLVVGGGVIGMELASIYSDMGRKVTVAEALDRILANMDREIGQNLKMILKKRGVDIHTGAAVEEISASPDGRLICNFQEKGERVRVAADKILAAVGRKPNVSGLFVSGFELEMKDGRISVNENYQTSDMDIYAVGDVIGGVQLAHAATAEGYAAVEHMAGVPRSLDLSVIPSCVYTSPEIGCAGVTADEARQMGLDVITKKYPMSANAKTVLSRQERGFIKVVADSKTGKIIGAQMMCARATDMIGEFVEAIASGLTLGQMAAAVRPHPTFCEAIAAAVRD